MANNKKTKEAFLVVPIPKEGYCICEVFDEIDEQLYRHIESDSVKKSYVYDEIRLNSDGYMVVTLRTFEGKHIEELKSVLNALKGDEEDKAQGTNKSQKPKKCLKDFKMFSFKEFLRCNTAKNLNVENETSDNSKS